MSRAATRKPYRMPVAGGTLVVLAYSEEDAKRRLRKVSRHRLRMMVRNATTMQLRGTNVAGEPRMMRRRRSHGG